MQRHLPFASEDDDDVGSSNESAAAPTFLGPTVDVVKEASSVVVGSKASPPSRDPTSEEINVEISSTVSPSPSKKPKLFHGDLEDISDDELDFSSYN